MSEMLQFGTESWVKQLMVELNNSKEYAEAAKTWEGDMYFVVESKGSALSEDVYMYLDLWHGKCRGAKVPENPSDIKPEFVIKGNVKTFKSVIDKKMEPIKAMLTRKLKLTGNMAKIMRNVKAANQLVMCCTLISTEFPLE